MRVIAGQYKGHRLFTPKDQEVRPTTDRTREFLFSYIGEKIVNASVLDLFAGTGSFGIEALSRHAESAVFVDQSSTACDLIRKNLDKVRAKAPVHRINAKSFVTSDVHQYDIIFCDPPYRFQHTEALINLIMERGILNKDGWLIYESGSKEILPSINGLRMIKEKKLGTTKITVWTENEP